MQDSNYIVVLFKNKVKKKIIKTFQTSKRSLAFYNKLLSESKDVVFNKTHENGYPCKYELALLEKKTDTFFPLYSTDEYGRNIKIELEDNDFSIVKISEYKIPEKIFDCQKNVRIDILKFIKSYLSKDGLKLISKLNNKIIVQIDDVFYIFSLKNDDDAERFVDSMSNHFLSMKRGDCIFVKDISTAQRKYLYDILVEKGFSKGFLYRQSTTFGVRK